MAQKHLFTAIALTVLSSTTMANPAFLSPIDEPISDARLRFIQKFADENAQNITQTQFNQRIEQHIQKMFHGQKSLDEATFTQRHMALDQETAQKFRDAQIKQTKIRFDTIDSNKDGVINLHEYQNTGLKSFARYDTNLDGYISNDDDKTTEERDAQQKNGDTLKHRLKPLYSMPTTHSAKGFITLYAIDGQHHLSLADYLKEREKQYFATDSNHDGVLNHTEYESEFLGRVDQMFAQVQRQQQAFLHTRFIAIDSNHDGKVSPKEVRHFAKQYFAFYDTNGDGSVTLTETLPIIQ